MPALVAGPPLAPAPEARPDVLAGPGLLHEPYLAARVAGSRSTAVAAALTREDVGGLRDEYPELVISPGVVALRVPAINNVPEWKRNQRVAGIGCRRSFISGWSARSRRRMIRTIAECEFVGHGWGMVTLTYPGDWERVARDPDAAHAHLLAFKKRWIRKYGAIEAVWKLEFQDRGAPHFHLLLRIPPAALPAVRRWCARAWYEVVGSGDGRHQRAGTSVDVSHRGWDGPAAVGRYFAKHGVWSTKEYQHEVPDAWVSTGRWWGIWGLERVREVVQLDDDTAVDLRRLLRRWYRANRRRRDGSRCRLPRSLQAQSSAFVLCRDGPGLALALGRALDLIEGGEQHAHSPVPQAASVPT